MDELTIEPVRAEDVPLTIDLFLQQVYPGDPERAREHFSGHIASRLMGVAEQRIATRATQAGIVVGLFDSYGPAQQLYMQRGYVPDGRGVCLGQRPLRQGEVVTIDHDLILWLTKDLSEMTFVPGEPGRMGNT